MLYYKEILNITNNTENNVTGIYSLGWSSLFGVAFIYCPMNVNNQVMQCNKRELGKGNKEHRMMNQEFGWLFFSCLSVFGIFPYLTHGF